MNSRNLFSLLTLFALLGCQGENAPPVKGGTNPPPSSASITDEYSPFGPRPAVGVSHATEVESESTERKIPDQPIDAQLTDGLCLFTLDNSHDPAGFAYGGRAIYYLDGHNYLRLFDVEAEQELWSLEVGDTNWVTFSNTGGWFATSHGDAFKALGNNNAEPGTVKIWNARTLQLHKLLTLTFSATKRISSSPDGKTLAVTSWNVGGDGPGDVSLWDVATGQLKERLPSSKKPPTHVLYSSDGTLLAYGGFDEQVTVWDIRAQQPRFRHKLDMIMDDLKFSPDGKFLIVCSDTGDRGVMDVLDVASGQRLPLFDNRPGGVAAVAISPLGYRLVTAGSHGKRGWGYDFWTFPETRPLRQLMPDSPRFGFGVTEFSPDGKLLIENVFGALNVWSVHDLFDEPFQRQLQDLQDRKLDLSYKQRRLQVQFEYDKASDEALKNLPVIQRPFELALEGGEVTDAGLAYLAKQPRLKGLDTDYCKQITAEGLAQLIDLPLRSLDATADSLETTEAMAVIGQMKDLEVLAISAPYGEAFDFSPLAKLTKLRDLEFQSANASTHDLSQLAKLTGLTRLNFFSAKMGDDDFKHFALLTQLRHFEVVYSEGFSGAGLAHLAAAKNLESLSLSCPDLTDAGIAHLAQFNNLRELRLHGFNITDQGLAAIAGLVELEYLELPEKIGDAGLAHLTKLTRLQALDLSGRPITDAGVEHLAKISSLRTLSLDRTQITDRAIPYLSALKNLAKLDIYGTGITEAGKQQLQKSFPEDHFLTINGP